MVTWVEPVVPVIVVGPVAVSVKSAGVAVPPCWLSTCLTRVRVGAIAVLVSVQVAFWPSARVTVPSATVAP